jgi:predicted nucleic acid-binding Zn ribbon protein|nr:MAG TPA: Thaumarchaeal output domain 1 [Caudoviricetes sp.]
MHTRVCRMCGKPFAAEKTEAVYCPDCSPKARAATVIRERTCMDCGAVFPGGPRARRCPDCRKTASREATRKYRASGGASRPLGSGDLCERCGAPYVVKSSRQRYCKACSATAVAEKIAPMKRAYNRQNAERLDGIARERKTGIRLCAVCGAPIMGSTPSNTCSDACRAIRKRERLAKNQAAYRQRKKEEKNNAD